MVNMEKIGKRFWDRWYEANELDKVEIVEELGIEKSAINSHAIATLVNSFFVDLAEYLKERKNLSTDEIRALLREQVELCGYSQKTVAFNLGISPQYLCDILGKRREPGPKVLKVLGLEKEGMVYKRGSDAGTGNKR